jgi:polyisoprenoid-binding protein YceI
VRSFSAPLSSILALLTAAGCGGNPDSGRSAHSSAAPAAQAAARTDRTGRRTFVIVPQESKATYIADEELFPGALKKLGLRAGKIKVVGSTQVVDGRFEFDPDHPDLPPGDNRFTVRVDTLTTNESRRDTYIREDGPRLNDYPLAIFRATTITALKMMAAPQPEVAFKLAGGMTIRDITKPAVFDVRAAASQEALVGQATTRLRMSDFGIEPLDFYNTLVVADEIAIDVRFTARPPRPGDR